MVENTKDNEQENLSQLPLSAQEEEAEAPLKRLRIYPRKVLESLGHLRIEKTRIKPIENTTPKTGGNADVEAAILVPAQSSHPSGTDDTEYVAVKKLRFDIDTNNDQVLAPFAHEINLLNDLEDENVVKIIGFVEDVVNGEAWMIFSWEKNGNLREFVRSANWELPERVSLLNDVAKGLGYLHGRTPPICHGDLKSLNILINCENRAIITDFGSARTMDSTTTESSVRSVNPHVATKSQYVTSGESPEMQSLKAELAASGAFITMTGPAWTIRWAAPELLDGELPGLASDIWALGWICWEAMTGNFPFDELNDISVVLRITQGDLPTVTDNAQLNQIKMLCSLMGECWRFDANARPTAMRCQQVISFMDQVVPSSDGEGNNMTTTRSSGLLHALGQIQLRNGMMPEARKYFQESFDVAKSVGDEQGMARALRVLGDVCYLQDEYGMAEYSYIQARGLYSRIGDQPGFAQSLKALGDVYRMRSDYAKAEESYVQARDIYSQIDDQVGFANSVKGLGDVYYMRDEYSKAEESYIQARDICSQIGDQLGFAHSVHRLGEVYRMRNEYAKAVDSYVQSRDLYSQIGSQLGFVQSVQALGDMYRIQEQYPAAEEAYVRARDIYSQIGSQLGYAQSLQGLGEVYLMRGKYSKAEEAYIEARNVYSQIGDQLGFAQSVQALGYLYCL